MTRCAAPECRAQFVRQRMGQKACSPECSIIVGRLKRARDEAKAQRLVRRHDAAKRLTLKTRSTLISEAQAALNKYVRLRDAGKGCISCGAMPEQKYGGAMDCGHYLSRGSAPHLRFHLWNMASQCVKDNRYRGGDHGNFRNGLIARIGLDKVEYLESAQWTAKFTAQYLVRLKKVFSKKANRAEKRNASLQPTIHF